MVDEWILARNIVADVYSNRRRTIQKNAEAVEQRMELMLEEFVG